VTDASRDGQELEEEAVQGSQLQEALRDGVHARRPERAAAAPDRHAGALLRERTRAGAVRSRRGPPRRLRHGRTRREADGEEAKTEQSLPGLAGAPGDDGWSADGLKRAASRISTLRMKLEEEDAEDEAFVHRARAGQVRSASSRVRALCDPRREAQADAQLAEAVDQRRRCETCTRAEQFSGQ